MVRKLVVPGGDGRAGMFSVISARFDGDNGGYTPIVTGNSYIQSVTWNEDGNSECARDTHLFSVTGAGFAILR